MPQDWASLSPTPTPPVPPPTPAPAGPAPAASWDSLSSAPPSDQPGFWESLGHAVENFAMHPFDNPAAATLALPLEEQAALGKGIRVAAPVYGSIVGGPVGGAVGGGIGEFVAEKIEEGTGERKAVNPVQVAVQTGLGAIPTLGKISTPVEALVKRAAQGAIIGAGGATATDLAEGRLPSWRELGRATALGATLGGVGGAVEAAGLPRETAPAPTPPEAVPEAPPAVVKPAVPVEPAPGAPAPPPEAPAPVVVKPTPAPAVPGPDTSAAVPPKTPRGTPTDKFGDKLREGQIRSSRVVYEGMVKHLPEDQQPAMLDLLEQHGGFQEQRRNVQPDARRDALAMQMAVDRTKAIPKGTALNSEQLKAYANAAVDINDSITEIEDRIRTTGQATPFDQAQLVALKHQQIAVSATIAGANTEAGRALRSTQAMGDAMKATSQSLLDQALKLSGVQQHPEAFSAAWAKTTNDMERMDVIKAFNRTKGFWGNALAVYYANILSGAKTHLRNIFGNTANAVFRMAAHPASVGYDIYSHAAHGTERQMFLGELPHGLVGGLTGLHDALRDFIFTVKNGYSPALIGEGSAATLSVYDNPIGKIGLPRPEIAGGGMNPLNWPGRLLEAEDLFQGHVIKRIQEGMRIYAKAMREHPTDAAARANMLAEFKLRPDLHPDVRAAAEAETERTLVREDPGRISKWIANGKQKIPALGFIVPFSKVPANIMRQAFEATPLAPMIGRFDPQATNAAANLMKAGGRLRSEAVGRMLTGTAALTLLGFYVAQGKVSGLGPADPRERAALMDSGWRPTSIKIGNAWYDYTVPFQMLAPVLSAMAQAYDDWHHSKDDTTLEAKALQIGATIMGTTLDQSFLSGLMSFSDAMSNPQQALPYWAKSTAQGFVPFSGAARSLTQALDPTIRDTSSVEQGIQSIIPGASTSLPARIGPLGNQVVRPGAAVERAVSPITRSPVSTDPVVTELARRKIYLGVPPKNLPAIPSRRLPAVELTQADREYYGTMQRRMLEHLFATPGWASLDDALAQQAVDNVLRRVRSAVDDRLRVEHFQGGGR